MTKKAKADLKTNDIESSDNRVNKWHKQVRTKTKK